MDENLVIVGRIAGPYGIKGWVKVNSFTEPNENIFDYGPWQLERDGALELCSSVKGRKQGKALIAQIDGVADRDAAAGLAGSNIRVDRGCFAEAGQGEYYWRDLLGLTVRTTAGLELGHVESLMETGANDVLVVEGERRRLVPFVFEDVITKVDLEAGAIVVDWDPDF